MYRWIIVMLIVIILNPIMLFLPVVHATDSLGSEASSGKSTSTISVTGRHIYVAWHTNNTVNGNEEVFFRASGDGGKTFGDKVYLSHTVSSNSTRIEIDSDGDIVAVQWWESNQTDNVPAMRVSNDNGETFGPTLKISKNGTIDEGG
jgi:hypothetical protein